MPNSRRNRGLVALMTRLPPSVNNAKREILTEGARNVVKSGRAPTETATCLRILRHKFPARSRRYSIRGSSSALDPYLKHGPRNTTHNRRQIMSGCILRVKRLITIVVLLLPAVANAQTAPNRAPE